MAPPPKSQAAGPQAHQAVAGRLAGLCALMAEERLDVYLVPSADEHLNEYLPPHKRRRSTISGFTGSAGDVAVTPGEAHLFVDSRYHLQAEQEVDAALKTPPEL